jgi:hypothetical protein
VQEARQTSASTQTQRRDGTLFIRSTVREPSQAAESTLQDSLTAWR